MCQNSKCGEREAFISLGETRYVAVHEDGHTAPVTVTRTSAGHYTYDYTPDAPGEWHIERAHCWHYTPGRYYGHDTCCQCGGHQ